MLLRATVAKVYESPGLLSAVHSLVILVIGDECAYEVGFAKIYTGVTQESDSKT